MLKEKAERWEILLLFLMVSVCNWIAANWMDKTDKRLKAIETQYAEDQRYHSPVAGVSEEDFQRMAQGQPFPPGTKR